MLLFFISARSIFARGGIASTMGTNSKRQKTTDARYHDLAALGRASYLSRSGMQGLLNAVVENGIPEAFDRRTQYRARKHLCRAETDYGRLVETHSLELIKGGNEEIAMQSPLVFAI